MVLYFKKLNSYKGMQYWKPFNDVLWQYINHPEARFDGDVGILSRNHVTIKSVTHIGKESNNLEKARIPGVQKDDYVVYGHDVEQVLAYKEQILLAEPKDVRKYGISQQTLYNIKRALLTEQTFVLRGKTIAALRAFTSASQQ